MIAKVGGVNVEYKANLISQGIQQQFTVHVLSITENLQVSFKTLDK